MSSTNPVSPTPNVASARGTMGFTLPIIAAAFCVATLTYGFVLWFMLSSRAGATPLAVSPVIRIVLLTLAGLALLGAVAWTRLRLTPAAEGGAGEVGGGFGSGASRSSAGLLLAFQRDVIIALALAETAAVLGFVLGFLAGSLRDYLYTGLPSLAVMALVIIPAIFRFMNRP